MNREPNFEGGGDTARHEFDAIVALWQAEGTVPEWPTPPAAPEPPTRPQLPIAEAPAPQRPVAPPPVRPRPAPPTTRPVESDAADEPEEHFVPPEPPPLPRIGPPAIVGGVLLVIGLLLVITPGWLGLSDIYGLPLGLISLAAGLGWLVLRLWPDSPSAVTHDDEGDDGAIL